MCWTRVHIRPYMMDILQKNVVKTSPYVSTMEGGKVYVFLGGSCVPIWGIPVKTLLTKTYHNEVTNEGWDVCFGPWGRYDTREATPYICSSSIYLTLSCSYRIHIDTLLINTPTTIIPNLKIHVDSYNNQVSIFV